MAGGEGPKTRFVSRETRLFRPQLLVLTGDKKGDELPLGKPGVTIRVGSGAACEIRLARLEEVHLELCLERDGSGVRVVDRSSGKTRLNGAPVHEAVLEAGGTLELGGVELRLQDATDRITTLPSAADHFGPAHGRSLAMREVFGVLEAIAPTEATVLLLGETGTGKDVLARAIHQASPRQGHRLLTLDCGAIAPSLIESELFGYERGAFTGADTRHVGAFEEANDSTLFLDEIGELPLDVQPKILRAIDEREIQRVGGSRTLPVNVRIIAATKRNLQEEVERGRFRRDLYFRLAVVPLTLPPLRERREDIPVLVETFRAAFQERTGQHAEIEPEEVQALLAHDWPGNVRELKNTIERALWLAQTGDGAVRFALPSAASMVHAGDDASATPTVTFDATRSFSSHKEQWESDFERRYLAWLMTRSDGSISKAARLAGMDRKHLRELLRKHDLIEHPAARGEEKAGDDAS